MRSPNRQTFMPPVGGPPLLGGSGAPSGGEAIPSPGYFRMPNACCEVGLPASRLGVLAYLHRRANARGECFPSIRRMARELVLGKDTVQRIVDELVQRGLVRCVPGVPVNGSKAVNHYFVQGVPKAGQGVPVVGHPVPVVRTEGRLIKEDPTRKQRESTRAGADDVRPMIERVRTCRPSFAECMSEKALLRAFQKCPKVYLPDLAKAVDDWCMDQENALRPLEAPIFSIHKLVERYASRPVEGRALEQ